MKIIRPIIALSVALFAFAACGDDEEGTSASGGSVGSGMSSSFSCCINGAWYDCPDAAASDTCFDNGDPSSCTANPARDPECS